VQLKNHPFDCFVSLTFLEVEVEAEPALHYEVLEDLNLLHGFPSMAAQLEAADWKIFYSFSLLPCFFHKFYKLDSFCWN
jgi:hypothetical protein